MFDTKSWNAKINTPEFWQNRDEVGRLITNLEEECKDKNWDTVLEWRELIYHRLSQFNYWDESLRLTSIAIASATATGNLVQQARLIHDSGNMFSGQGQHKDAETAYEHSYSIYKELGEHTLATHSLHMLALTQRSLGKEKKARELATQCIHFAERFNLGPWIAHPYHLLGWLARDKAHYIEALDYVHRALRIHETHNESDRPVMLARANYDVAKTLILMRRLKEAEGYVQALEEIKETPIFSRPERMVYVLRGDIALEKHNTHAAIDYYQQALDLAQIGPEESRVAENWLSLARALFIARNYSKAISYFKLGRSQLIDLGLWNRTRIRAWVRNRFIVY